MTLIVHGEAWDEIPMGGDVMSKACLISFKRNGRVAAVASIFRDLQEPAAA